MVLREHTEWLPAIAGGLVCILAAVGCSQAKEPPIPPGMVRVDEKPIEINTPPLKVKARIGPPFPENNRNVDEEVDAALRDMGLDMKAREPQDPLNAALDSPGANVIGGPEDDADAGAEDAGEPSTGNGDTPENVSKELAALRSDIARMQSMLDLVLDEFVIELKNENNRLREEVASLRRELENEDHQDAAPPLPESPAASDSPPSPVPDPPEVPTAVYDEMAQPNDAESIRYAVIKEWGRDAEEAARMNDASTLKGLICAVPPNATDTQLAELGRWLRDKYADYENINIDVFDDVEAARRFAETNRIKGGRRVLNISKHPATNRDTIVLIRKDETTVIPTEDTP
ncbi:MAG: hypothetical protein R6V12_01535 [Candidatus Hydrogenedentota bacterium]